MTGNPGMDNALLISAGLLLAAIVVMAIALTRLLLEREKLVSVLNAHKGESLEEAARSRIRAAGEVAVVPLLESRLSQLFTHLPVPVILVDDRRIIIDLSARAEEELDQPRRRRGLLETLESHDLDEAAARAIASLRPEELDVRLYASGRRTYHARLFPYRREQARECLILLQDTSTVTDYGALRSQFAATVSHELRTPLAGIKALVESLQNPDIKPDDTARFLGRLDLETTRLAQLIDEILFLSSLESGAAQGLQGESDLGEVTARVLEKLAQPAEEREVTVKNEVPVGIKVPLAERMAATVVSNLVENAIKYSGRGSRIEVAAGKEGDRTRITVRDDGIGMDAEHLPHIFERFYRVDKARSRRLGGTGLGLSIVKHVVESAGGEVKASSRAGFGTEMTISFPCR